MNGNNLKGTVLPVAGILVFLTALGVSIFTQPLKDTRPYVTEVRDPFEKVRARLWQDPFRAVLDHVKAVLGHLKEVGLKPGDSNRICVLDDAGKSQTGADGYVKAQIDERRKTGAVTVLGAMVSAAPYAEETETRIRYRYAILSGLRRLGFSPEDAEHIDFVTLQYGKNPDLSKDVTLSNIMPFEWLNNKTGDSVLLLWINDDLFPEEPLSRLAGLSACIGFKDKERVKDRKELKFKIIGPAGSTTLLGMHQEMKKANREKKASLLAALSGVEIYSATATVDASTAIQEEGDPLSPSPKKDAEDIFEKEFHNFSQQIFFKRTTPSDLKLAQMLVDELGLRDLDLLLKQEKNDRIHNHKDPKDPYGGHRDHVVLIAEWDTVYGQSLPETFERALKEKHNENFNPKAKQYVKEVKDITWVHRFSYLRGLDGILPGEPGKKDDKQEKENSAPEDIKKLEQPTGKSQYDYLRRLAESIYSFDQELQAKKHGSIKAIGVLGNDFYDKYLVLQALRQRFPGLIFFTTDLDARLLHPDYIKWTRNLVVASNFGLSLRRDIQGDVPPFRDNYSTSMFLATLWAFGKERDSVLIEEEMKKPPEPRIFEVGRHTAVDLRPANSPPAGEVHPVPYEAGTIAKTSAQIAVIAILLLFFLCFLSERVREGVKRLGFTGKKHPKKAMILLFLLILVVVYFYAQVLRNPDEEPFSVFEGVSIWPTELIRIIGVLFALQFWVKSRRILRENSIKLGQEFQFKGCPGCEDSGEVGKKAKDQGAGRGDSVWKKAKTFFGRMKYDWEVDSQEEGFTVDKNWAGYVLRDTWPYAVPRLIVIMGLYLVLSICVINFFGRPMRPLRGFRSAWFDDVIVILSVISFISLTSYIFDMTKLFHRFIRAVSEATPNWSKRSLKQFQADSEEAKKPIGEWMLIHLIASRSDVVGRLIFYPFIVWFILFISRINYWDNWQTPIGLAVVISMGAIYAWSGAFVLRRSAEKARTEAVRRLTEQLVGALAEEKPDQDRVKRIEFVLDEIKSIREGAFSPFTQHPAVQALIVPFGGVGGLYLIEEFLSKLNF